MKLFPLFVAFFATSVVEGAPFSGFPGFGSKAGTEHYAATNVTALGVRVYQNTPTGQVDIRPQFAVNKTFALKADLNAYFIQQLTILAEGALTNQMVDKDKPFRVSGIADHFCRHDTFPTTNLRCSKEFFLTKNPDGSYSLPDFAKLLSLELVGTVVYEIFDEKIEYGRIEVYTNPLTSSQLPFFETDTRFEPQDPPMEVNMEEGYVQIRTDRVISESSGPTSTKVMLGLLEPDGTHSFKVVKSGVEGLASETPITTSLAFSLDGTVTLTIGGGDPGRVVQVQKAVDLTYPGQWVDVGLNMVIPRYGATLQFKENSYYSPSGFYRIRTVNRRPY